MELQDRIGAVGNAGQMRGVLRHRVSARNHRADGSASELQDRLPILLGEFLLKELRGLAPARVVLEPIDAMEPALDRADRDVGGSGSQWRSDRDEGKAGE